MCYNYEPKGNIVDDEAYNKKIEDQARAYEALCRRCGECCGAGGEDPCNNLTKLEDGTYICSRYADRHGPQQTRSGKIFTCVNIRDVHEYGMFFKNCGYNQ